jgi:glycerol-3-phosphate acyltransferase PlsY
LPVGFSIILSYLLGSIPFGHLIVKTTAGGDIRQTGSGGTGATNVSRSAGKLAGVATLILDALKGAAAVVLARWILVDIDCGPWWLAGCCIIAVVGHIFPIWLRFRGGKGVATGVGIFLMIAPLAVALAAVLFLIVVWSTRYVSLGSMIAAVAVPCFVSLQTLIRPTSNSWPTLFSTGCAAVLIVYAHRGNIARLLNHTENRFH